VALHRVLLEFGGQSQQMLQLLCGPVGGTEKVLHLRFSRIKKPSQRPGFSSFYILWFLRGNPARTGIPNSARTAKDPC
jgi:hypothetical protein